MHGNSNCRSFHSNVSNVGKSNYDYDCILHAKSTIYIFEHVVYGEELKRNGSPKLLHADIYKNMDTNTDTLITYKKKSANTLTGTSFVTINTGFLHVQLPIRFLDTQKQI